jgi:hypothetical protein
MNDFVLDKDNDLTFVDGDFQIRQTDLQHQKLITYTKKGDWKYAFAVGVGIERYFLNENLAGLLSEIRKQLVMDGMKVQSVTLDSLGEIRVKGEYE